MLRSMAKYVYIQLYASQGAPLPAPLRIRADKIEDDEHEGKLTLSLDGQKVGELNKGLFMGWWIQDEG